MSLNFRMAYNEAFHYTDLFPKTKIEAIKNVKSLLSFSSLKVSVPPFTGLTQEIAVTTTEAQNNAPFYVQLANPNIQSMTDYLTINQIELSKGKLIITRLGNFPKRGIEIMLYFKEGAM